MHSSQNEQDNRHYARAAKVLMLEPADSQEARDFTLRALELSEQFDTPVLLRTTTRIAHSDSIVHVGSRQILARECRPRRDPVKYVMIPAYARRRRLLVEERTRTLQAFVEKTDLNRLEMADPRLGIIASGVAYQYAKEVMPQASFFKLGITWPLPRTNIELFADAVDRLWVVEELDPFLASQIREWGLDVETLPAEYQIGELSPHRVSCAMSELLRDRACEHTAEELQPPSDLPPRPPVLCPGCPHRGVFMTLRKLKAFVTGDIGCYTLGTLPPLSALDTCLCMGAGVGQAHGIEAACRTTPIPTSPTAPQPSPAEPVVAVIGDSTFVHSGITGLINIAYNGGASVVVILDNGTTAMTGGQDHPGTGVTLSGRPGRRLDLPGICRAAGIPHVEVINPRNLEQTEAALRAALASDEPWAIIAQAPCVLITRERAPACTVEEQTCVRCGLCLRIGCPALFPRATDDPRRPQPVIDEALCQGCALCAQQCPKLAIVPRSG